MSQPVMPLHHGANVEEWSMEQMNEFLMKLGFVQCEIHDSTSNRNVQYYQRVHEVCRVITFCMQYEAGDGSHLFFRWP